MKKQILICCISIFIVNSMYSQKDPLKIYFGIYVKNMVIEEKGKSKSNRFSADAYWWMRYQYPKDTSAVSEIENIEFVNADISEDAVDERHITVDSITGDKTMYLTGHLKGDFLYFPNYRYYPFDKLVLSLIIENKNLTSQVYELIPDSSSYDGKEEKIMGIANDINFPNFKILESRFIRSQKNYETNFGDLRFPKHLNYSRLNFSVVIERNSYPFLLKILIPVALITLMGYLVFFVPAAKLEVAVGLTVTSLLSCIAVQLTMTSDIPVSGYLIASDKIFYLSYVLISYAMVQTILTYNFQKRKKNKLATVIEYISRWLYPVAFIGGLILIILTAKYSTI